jgi:hypothetical protein
MKTRLTASQNDPFHSICRYTTNGTLHMKMNMKPKEKDVSVVLLIRVALMCAIIFEFVQMYQESISHVFDNTSRQITTSTSDENYEVLNTHLALNNINVEEISVNSKAAIFIPNKDKSASKKKGFRRIADAWRKKVTYTSKGIIIEGSSNDLIQQRLKESISSDKDMNLIEMSKQHTEPHANVSVAICFKTLFGEIDLGIVLQWAAYNRLLGFDRIFMWYRPEMVHNPRFAELQSLPYVTLTLNTRGRRENYYNQWWTEETCNRDDQFAGTYDYALHADIDEYLWFPKHIGIKEFLLQNPNLNYLSFGKRMYTLDHNSEIETSLQDHVIDMKQSSQFAVSKYAFYIENFCYNTGDRRGHPFCPTWRGRAKVIVRPKQYIKIDTHGNIKEPNFTKGEIHFLPEQAHFMEWPDIFAKHNVTKRERVDFDIQNEEQIHIHNLERAFKPEKNGNYLMRYDTKLKEWFQFVISRYSTKNNRVGKQTLQLK